MKKSKAVIPTRKETSGSFFAPTLSCRSHQTPSSEGRRSLYAEIIVGRGRSCLVDWADVPFLKKMRWTCTRKDRVYYAVRSYGRAQVGPYMHQYIMGRINAKDGLVIDHINGNGLDNRRSNLRVVTPYQNLMLGHAKSTHPKSRAARTFQFPGKENKMKLKKVDAWPIAKLAFPEYNGRKFRASICGRIMFHDMNWAGGTKNEYKAIELVTDGKVNAFPSLPPYLNPVEGKTVDIPQGWAVVEHSFFCGIDTGMTIHIGTQDLPRLLPNGIGA